MKNHWFLVFDGGTSCNNPDNYGQAYGSYKLADENKKTILIRKKVQLGSGSNNYAEAEICYRGLLDAFERGCKKIVIIGDSQIIINRINAPKVRNFSKGSSTKFITSMDNIYMLLMAYHSYLGVWKKREYMVRLFGH